MYSYDPSYCSEGGQDNWLYVHEKKETGFSNQFCELLFTLAATENLPLNWPEEMQMNIDKWKGVHTEGGKAVRGRFHDRDSGPRSGH